MTLNEFDEPASGDSHLTSPVVWAVRLTGGVVGMVIGSVLLVGGFVLYAGETAGRLLIFPFAGRLTMLLGIFVFGIVAVCAGRREALVLSGLVAVGGLALYLIGLVYVEQFGNRICQAIGLLTTLLS
jgi:hypothetical protein